MFTLKDLQTLKALVTSELESDLRITNAIYNGIGGTDKELYHNDDMLLMKSNTIQYEKGEVDLSDLDSILDSKGAKKVGKATRLYGYTTTLGRRDYFSKAEFSHIWYIPIEKLTDELVRRYTKKRLNKMFRPKDLSRYTAFDLDCKLMEQFKLGRLTMEQVIKGSKEQCQM